MSSIRWILDNHPQLFEPSPHTEPGRLQRLGRRVTDVVTDVVRVSDPVVERDLPSSRAFRSSCAWGGEWRPRVPSVAVHHQAIEPSTAWLGGHSGADHDGGMEEREPEPNGSLNVCIVCSLELT
jgi:hypothetical protein